MLCFFSKSLDYISYVYEFFGLIHKNEGVFAGHQNAREDEGHGDDPREGARGHYKVAGPHSGLLVLHYNRSCKVFLFLLDGLFALSNVLYACYK